VIGSVINEFLPEDTGSAIGGTINEIINSGAGRNWEAPRRHRHVDGRQPDEG